MTVKASSGVIPLLLILLSSWMAPVLGQAPELPIFDAHIHYSQGDWDTLSPQQALAILEKAGVRQALVSSTPDDGTLKLYQADAKRVVPFLRPYRTRGDMASWHSDPEVQAYVEERLERGAYRGIGEFHLSAADADKPVIKRCAELAAKQGIFLHAHVDEVAVEKLLTLYPDVKILWAHAGMSSPVSEVRRIVEGFPRVWMELSMRTDVASGGTLNPEWRALFLKHPDRFMVGTDTWTTSRWDAVVEEARATRRWLGQLPRDVAAQIAYRNGGRLFGRP
ncbi:MAG: amidohydrolase family protein [Candidatus Methylomirabilales bacterium]